MTRNLEDAAGFRFRLINETEKSFDAFDVAPIAEDLSEEQIMMLNRYHKTRLYQSFKSALGIDVRPLAQDLGVRPLLRQKIADNVQLITSIPAVLKPDLLGAYEKTLEEFGFDQQKLKATLIKRFKVADNRAKLITRDQTSKTIGALTQARHGQLGVSQYTWSTSGDERVRESHMVLNGTLQTWGITPPVGHPGEDIQCRCVARPVIE